MTASLNLLPNRDRPSTPPQTTRWTTVVIALALGWVTSDAWSLASLNAEIADLEASLAHLAAAGPSAAPATEEHPLPERSGELPSILCALGTIGRALPSGVRVSELRASPDSLSVAGEARDARAVADLMAVLRDVVEPASRPVVHWQESVRASEPSRFRIEVSTPS